MAAVESRAEQKRHLRRIVLQQRRSLEPADRLRRQQLIEAQLWRWWTEHAVSAPAKRMTILSYMAMDDEVDVSAFQRELLLLGHHLVLPRVALDAQSGMLDLYEVNAETRWLRNRWGILEPEPDSARMLLPEEESKVDIVIVPGVAYSKCGERLGFGGGFYDRLYSRLPAAVWLAPIFATQLVEQVPVEPHDLKVNWLVSETDMIQC